MNDSNVFFEVGQSWSQLFHYYFDFFYYFQCIPYLFNSNFIQLASILIYLFFWKKNNSNLIFTQKLLISHQPQSIFIVIKIGFYKMEVHFWLTQKHRRSSLKITNLISYCKKEKKFFFCVGFGRFVYLNYIFNFIWWYPSIFLIFLILFSFFFCFYFYFFWWSKTIMKNPKIQFNLAFKTWTKELYRNMLHEL